MKGRMKEGIWIAVLVMLFTGLLGAEMVAQRQPIAFLEWLAVTPHDLTIADKSGIGENAYTITTPDKSAYYVTCLNTTGACSVYFVDSSATIRKGTQMRIVNVGSVNVTIHDVSGASEVGGAMVLGQYDNMSLEYIGDRWVEVARSNN
jgi:hypothetical protein